MIDLHFEQISDHMAVQEPLTGLILQLKTDQDENLSIDAFIF